MIASNTWHVYAFLGRRLCTRSLIGAEVVIAVQERDMALSCRISCSTCDPVQRKSDSMISIPQYGCMILGVLRLTGGKIIIQKPSRTARGSTPILLRFSLSHLIYIGNSDHHVPGCFVYHFYQPSLSQIITCVSSSVPQK